MLCNDHDGVNYVLYISDYAMFGENATFNNITTLKSSKLVSGNATLNDIDSMNSPLNANGNTTRIYVNIV